MDLQLRPTSAVLVAVGALFTAACMEDPGIADPTAAQGIAVTSEPELGASSANDAATHTYEITVTNLTTGQPMSPGVFVTHTKQQSLLSVGSAASEGIRLIAENGDPSTAVGAVTGQPGIFDVQSIGAPIHRVGGPGPNSLTFQITARANANRFSFAVMLICTNDGFTGLDGIKLPGGFSPATYYTAAYDAGTEMNDEASGSIVPPCFGIGPVSGPAGGGARTPTSDVIAPHAGIQGGADLDPAQHGWSEPVARVTIQRVD
ncbi:MAG: hypothetical protein HKM89_08810 [Gemmatimonadales bacterium]|nr:hypothetical protein [Gemmatimonadales bacterium]